MKAKQFTNVRHLVIACFICGITSLSVIAVWSSGTCRTFCYRSLVDLTHEDSSLSVLCSVSRSLPRIHHATRIPEDSSRDKIPDVSLDTTILPDNIQVLRATVADRNRKAVERVKFATQPPSNVYRYVIVVQVHDRVVYLNALLESLTVTRNISDALVILSHDVLDDQVDQLVGKYSSSLEIVQIYFPHSIQLFPNEFPGLSEQDCTNKTDRAAANKPKCFNRERPDSYGHHRKPQLSQVKHHWWWKFYFVFTQLGFVTSTKVPVIFAEEDHYMLPDALFVLDELYRMRGTACAPYCDIVSLAHHKVAYMKAPESFGQYIADQSVVSRDNIGLIFDHDHFEKLHQFAERFCDIDDYNWDWTLQFIVTKHLKAKDKMILPVAPRVTHIGQCGGIHHKTSCDPRKNVDEARNSVRQLQDVMFPAKMVRSSLMLDVKGDANVNGGWADPRDRALCRKIYQDFYRTKV